MATLYSDAFDANDNPKAYKYVETGVFPVTATYTLTGALVTTNTIQMVPVAAGLRVKDVVLGVTALDTGTSITIDVGDTDSTDDVDRYIASTTVGQSNAAGVARLANNAGLNYQFSADGTIDVQVTTAPETAVTEGTIKLVAFLSAADTP